MLGLNIIEQEKLFWWNTSNYIARSIILEITQSHFNLSPVVCQIIIHHKD